MNHLHPLKNLKADIPASIVVFFVALPLCLGIALASGAPLFSGLIAGIIGGIVVGALSGSAIGVSGPAAGLAAIVLVAISTLGSFRKFLISSSTWRSNSSFIWNIKSWSHWILLSVFSNKRDVNWNRYYNCY